MEVRRRSFLQVAAASIGSLAIPMKAKALVVSGATAASPLVCLTPLGIEGDTERSQAEVWFVTIGSDVFVCVSSTSYFAQAPLRGECGANLLIGETAHSIGSQAPSSIEALASVVEDPATVRAALARFAHKYQPGWDSWGGRIQDELAAGSRTMLRYEIRGA